MTEPQVIEGPTVDVVTNGVIYQVTLASGMVVTKPSCFGDFRDEAPFPSLGVVVAEDGRVLTIDRHSH